jgi:hypothetical protein
MSGRALYLVAIAIVVTSRDAGAEGVVIKQMFRALVAESPLEGRTLDAPEPVGESVRVADGGTKVGGGSLTTVLYDRMRASFGFGAFGIPGVHLATDLEGVTDATSFGFYVETAVGYELRLGPIFPYADLRASFETANVVVRVDHPPCGERSYPMSGRKYLTVGPSLGMFIPFGDFFFADVSGYAGVLGERGVGGFGGLGVWFPVM